MFCGRHSEFSGCVFELFGLGFVVLGLGFDVIFSCLVGVRCFGIGVRCYRVGVRVCGVGSDYLAVLDWGPKEYSGLAWIRVRGITIWTRLDHGTRMGQMLYFH